MNWIKINDKFTVGDQPTEEQLHELANQGFTSVVNLRTSGEPNAPFAPEQEGDKVEGLGMKYVHFPVSMQAMNDRIIDEFRMKVKELPEPVFVHCASGKRAGAITMMHCAIVDGMTGKETLEQAEKLGFKTDIPQLAEFIRTYVDRHSHPD